MTMIPSTLLLTLDQLLIGFTCGVTIWHFFIQAPFLLQLMGKEKFVPIMMKITRLWIQTIFVSSTLATILSTSLFYISSNNENAFQLLILPICGWVAVAIKKCTVVPKALKAGARSVQQRKGDSSSDIKDFAIDGGGKSETKAMHQTVVLFVVLMMGSFLTHLLYLNNYGGKTDVSS